MCIFRGSRRRALSVAGRIAGAIAAIGPILSPAVVHAQGTQAITSSGLKTKVTPSVTDTGTKYSITGGTRPENGPNLFHSFGVFNLPGAGDVAEFKNETGFATTDILARVTEPLPSSIFGTIRTTGFGSANLFLVNPSGWIFGSTAALDVRGSFHVSTANYVLLSDGARFNTTPGQDALLTSAPPAAFGFLGPTGPISIQGSVLSVDRGRTLSIVGGDVTIQGAMLTVPGGRVQVGSFAAKGAATVQGLQGGFASLGRIEISAGTAIAATGDVQFDGDGNVSSVGNGGTVLIRGAQVDIQGTSIDVSGTQATDAAGNPLGSPSGTVVIRGGRLFIDASSVTAQTSGDAPGGQAAIDIRMDESIRLANGTFLLSATSGNARGGDIQLTAGESVDGAGSIALETGGSAASMTSGPGRGGDVRLTAASIAVDNAGIATLSQFGEGIGGDVTLKGGVIALTTGGSIQSINQNATLEGRGGSIILSARDSVVISGQNDFGQASSLISSTLTTGNGGQILIQAESLTMQSATTITSSASFENLGGAGGNIAIDVGRLTLADGATISTNVSTLVPGGFLGGSVTVNVSGEADISGTNGGIFSIAFGAAPGDIALRVGALRLMDGAQIQGGSFAGDSEGANVTLEARDFILIADLAGVSSQAVNLDVGRVQVSAPSLTIDRGFINTGTLGVGRAGDISIDVGTLTLTRGGQIASSSIFTASGGGGTVTVTAAGPVAISGSAPGGEPVLPEPFRGFIQDTASGIFSTASSESPTAGAAGSIRVSTPTLTLSEGGKLSVTTIGPGNAGLILLNVGAMTMTSGAGISSSTSGVGLGGNVTIDATSVSVSGPGTGLFSTATSTGDAGRITVSAPTVSLADAARIDSGTTGAGEGGTITVEAGSALSLGGGAGLFSTTEGTGAAGSVVVSSPTVTMTGVGTISVATIAGGGAGDIQLNTGTLTVASGAQLNSSTRGAGQGGVIAVQAVMVALSGPGSGFFSTAASTGNAGQITVSAPTVSLADAARIDSGTTGAGQGGTITVEAGSSLSLGGGAGLFSTTEGTGAAGSIVVSSPTVTMTEAATISVATIAGGGAGDIQLNAGTLTVASGAQLNSSTRGAGQGGLTAVQAATVALSGPGSGFFSTAASTGNAGQITVSAPTVSLADAARIDSGTTGAGKGGTITVEAGSALSLSGGAGLFSNAGGTGPGGDIEITAGQVELLGGTLVSASSTGSASALAGNVNITFGETLFMQGSSITTQSLLADGGNIAITSTGSVLQLINSQITTSVQSGVGAGGNIAIGSVSHPLDFSILKNSQIRADAFGGPGGNITIFADVYLSSGSLVSASSALSAPGTINVEARVTDLSGSLVELPNDVLQAANLLRAACTSRVAEGKASSLVVAGREGVPPDPEGLLWSPLGAPLADLSATRGKEHQGEMFPHFAGIWLGSNCAR